MSDDRENLKASSQIEQLESIASTQPYEYPLQKIFMVASIATGVQFIWALQLSLLTPYVQMLGIPHNSASFIWLLGPICGIVVQPIAGHNSDNCASRFGRRRPYIAFGTVFTSISVFLISYSVDIGHIIGDPLGDCIKPRAIAIFVTGFFLLHVANNILQGPCRAFLGDMSGTNSSKKRTSNASYAFFQSLGGVLGYAAGSLNSLHKIFPFTITNVCDRYCANLKSCFFLAVAILIIVTTLALSFVKETPNPKETESTNIMESGESRPKKGPVFLGGIVGTMKDLPKSMWILLLVTFMNIFASFPFRMFGTDWMGREVYGGKVGDGKLYEQGVHIGSLGLMIQAIVLGLTSLGIEVLARGLGGGVKMFWGIANFCLAFVMCLTVLITKLAESSRRHTITNNGKIAPLPPNVGVKAGALVLFGVMGIPQAATSIIPYTLASIYSDESATGQGVSVGILNLAIVSPQLIVSLLSGPWDALFGGGNLPSFIVGAFAAAVSGILGLAILPNPPPYTRI